MLNRMLTQKEQYVLVFVGAAIAVGALAALVMQHQVTANKPVQETPVITKAQPENPVPYEVKTAPDSDKQPQAAPPQEESPEEATAVAPPPEPERKRDVAVYAAGAVAAPGLYHFTEDARLDDLIRRAGGLADGADTTGLNLSAKLIDGSTLTIPRGAVRAVVDGTLTAHGAERADNPAEYLIGYRPRAAHADAAVKASEESPASVPTKDNGEETTETGPLDLNTATQDELEKLPGIGPGLALRIIQYRSTTPFTAVEQLDEVPGIGPKRMEQMRPFVTVQ